jgi:metal-dependent amidase/aminoacylase/carboxypeptidase family protein
MDEVWRTEAHSVMRKLSSELTASMGAQCVFHLTQGYPALMNDERITRKAMQYAKHSLGEENVFHTDPLLTAEDFAWFAREVPSCMYFLGVRNPADPVAPPLHSPNFTLDEAALKTGTAVMTEIILSFLNET